MKNIKINLNFLYKIFRPVIFLLDAEFCHNCAIWLLKNNLIPSKNREYTNLKTNFFDKIIQNPIGLAAGFDKNGHALENLSRLGFGFVEVGTVTPRPQSGNTKPRLFRLVKQRSIVNRFGFNNEGIDVFVANLKKFYLSKNKGNILLGANIGKNKDSSSISDDYVLLLKKVYNYCDYITINISSPNTPGLRDIQGEQNLQNLLEQINIARKDIVKFYKFTHPILLKLSPDITNDQMVYISRLVLEYKIDGVILANTTIQKTFDNFSTNLEGGLSGELLCNRSLQVLKDFYEISKGQIPIISVGGISTAKDIKQRLLNGAFAVQIYSSLVYQGFGLVEKLKKDLSSLNNNNSLQ